ncbi:glycine--tRNA ligase subunit beta [Acidobacteria bacterium AH-259-D05]|nr:glycine--tRNA ligase subunit beta [Acidobacteria bacterium AH-259-D05]
MKNKFLFELGLEEVPADMISPALDQMCQSCERLLSEKQISFEPIQKFASPRRLAFLLEGLPDCQPEREEVILGPSQSVAYEQENKPTKALEGFARKAGVSVADLDIVDTERGGYVGYRKKIQGKPLPEILQEILPQVLTSISWPRNMYWRENRFRFIRPLRWCLALLNNEVLPFEFEGIAAGNTTQGHRFLGQGTVQVLEVDQYLEKLRENYVLVDVQERETKITTEMEKVLPHQLHVLPDRELFEMVVHLNEYPTVICGEFNKEFLKLPREVLVTVKRHHQKYFSVVNDADEIQPYFLTVVNTNGDPNGRICKGHEKVLAARLEDSAFFWKTDRKQPLKERVEQLNHIVFQETLGTYHAKTKRLRNLCSALDNDANLDTAAWLCKTDLTTDMVREFPELQGVIGGLYAREEGYPEEVWKAISEHYKPVSLEDQPPSTRLGALLSIADKVDTIVGCFAIDIVPTGSSDPFALRRKAQGLIKVLFDYQLDLSLHELTELAQKNFPKELEGKKIDAALMNFLQRRVRHIFQEKGISYDVLNAVLAVEIRGVHDAYKRAQSLSGIKDQDDFEALAAAYKRTKNILANQSIDLAAVNENILVEPEERALFRAYSDIQPEVDSRVGEGDYGTALRQIASLRKTVDQFFDKVLVMASEENLRNNRLRLLHDISQLFLKIADISEIVQENQTGE